jgi:hypothetical protein
MLTSVLTHWKSSLAGVVGATFVGLSLTVGLDNMSGKQLAFAALAALGVALKGLVSADADKVVTKTS